MYDACAAAVGQQPDQKPSSMLAGRTAGAAVRRPKGKVTPRTYSHPKYAPCIETVFRYLVLARPPSGRGKSGCFCGAPPLRYHKDKIQAVLQLLRGISSFAQGGSFFRREPLRSWGFDLRQLENR
jgi:hypothetical protein